MKFFSIIIITFITIINIILPTPTSASHQEGTEGWYCDEVANQVWHDLPDGTHELWEDCNLSGKVCTWLETPEGYNANADCLPPAPPPEEGIPPVPEEETKPPEPPAPASELSSKSPSGADCGTSDETALCNLNEGLLPPDIAKNIKPKEEGLFLGQILSRILEIFGFTPSSREMFASRAETQHQSELPQELTPISGDILKQTGQRLGGETGIYSVNFPPEAQPHSTTRDFERLYEKANFPAGVCPITNCR